jgi:hypothetical protein
MQTFIEYILPNIVLSGGIYLIAKYVENSTQHHIDNYDESMKMLNQVYSKFK